MSVSLWASSLSLPSLLYGQMSQMKRRVAVFYHFVCVTTGFFWYSPFLLLFLVNKRQRSSLNEIKTIDNCLLFARQTVILTLPPKNSSFTSSTICHYFITHTPKKSVMICFDSQKSKQTKMGREKETIICNFRECWSFAKKQVYVLFGINFEFSLKEYSNSNLLKGTPSLFESIWNFFITEYSNSNLIKSYAIFVLIDLELFHNRIL